MRIRVPSLPTVPIEQAVTDWLWAHVPDVRPDAPRKVVSLSSVASFTEDTRVEPNRVTAESPVYGLPWSVPLLWGAEGRWPGILRPVQTVPEHFIERPAVALAGDGFSYV